MTGAGRGGRESSGRLGNDEYESGRRTAPARPPVLGHLGIRGRTAPANAHRWARLKTQQGGGGCSKEAGSRGRPIETLVGPPVSCIDGRACN